jgi:hypothetical protein
MVSAHFTLKTEKNQQDDLSSLSCAFTAIAVPRASNRDASDSMDLRSRPGKSPDPRFSPQ